MIRERNARPRIVGPEQLVDDRIGPQRCGNAERDAIEPAERVAPDALAAHARAYRGRVIRMVEAQHRISTNRLADGAGEQALLEAPDFKARAETLIAITEIAIARESDEPSSRLQ